MSTVDRALITHVAKLAALSISEDEVARFAVEVGAILEHVRTLDELDTSEVEPTAHVQLDRAAWRDDAERPSLSREDALAQAPRAAHDGFAVPTFVGS
jgi:aspartyl-tRNA(Asn)/glutamyl-tRNA(Gln) amidotransferase subunit C